MVLRILLVHADLYVHCHIMVLKTLVMNAVSFFWWCSDFFDAGVTPSTSADASDTSVPHTTEPISEQLPEGFFDDPKQDAKVIIHYFSNAHSCTYFT